MTYCHSFFGFPLSLLKLVVSALALLGQVFPQLCNLGLLLLEVLLGLFRQVVDIVLQTILGTAEFLCELVLERH